MSITGMRLKNLRNSKNASQSDVATAIGISRTAYVKYETGASRPVRKLNELAKYFNVTTDYLLGNDNAGQHLSKEQTILLKGFKSLNTEGQNNLMMLLNSLLITHSKQKSGKSTAKI